MVRSGARGLVLRLWIPEAAAAAQPPEYRNHSFIDPFGTRSRTRSSLFARMRIHLNKFVRCSPLVAQDFLCLLHIYTQRDALNRSAFEHNHCPSNQHNKRTCSLKAKLNVLQDYYHHK